MSKGALSLGVELQGLSNSGLAALMAVYSTFSEPFQRLLAGVLLVREFEWSKSNEALHSMCMRQADMFSPLADVENGENKGAVLNGKSKALRQLLPFISFLLICLYM